MVMDANCELSWFFDLQVELNLIHVTPAPILSRLERSHNRMMGPVEMLGRVLVLRGIAAAHVTARQAHS